LMPSLWYEGFLVTIVEAFACGLPVVTTALGGLPDLVEDGVTGRLFQSGSSGAEIARVLQSLLDDPGWGDMAANARKAYERSFTSEIAYGNALGVYDFRTDS